jgi:integrase
MPLTDARIRAARATERPYRLADAGGLYMQVTPAGGRLWRLKYRWAGREKLLALGQYPAVTLVAARAGRDEAKRLIAAGVDPGAERRAEKVRRRQVAAHTFRGVAEAWLATRAPGWRDSHAEKVRGRLANYINPEFGARPVGTITGPEVVDWAQAMLRRTSADTTRRCLQVVGQVFRYAVRAHLASTDPSYRVAEILPPKSRAHFAAITDPDEIGELLRAIDGYRGTFVVASALRLAPLVFVRPGELRGARWREFDLEAGDWRIPADRMKAGRDHWVPLARQAVDILRRLRPLTGHRDLVFPSIRGPRRPISENTLTGALRALGYDAARMQVHGFRTMASTRLHEQGLASPLIEAQLAHGDPDEVRAAYNRAQWRDDRRAMMQAWADYLDERRATPRAR